MRAAASKRDRQNLNGVRSRCVCEGVCVILTETGRIMDGRPRLGGICQVADATSRRLPSPDARGRLRRCATADRAVHGDPARRAAGAPEPATPTWHARA